MASALLAICTLTTGYQDQHPSLALLRGVVIQHVTGMALQMTMIMGMEEGTGLSTAEAITEMGRATTTLGEQLQQALLLRAEVQLLQLLHLAKLQCPESSVNFALSCHADRLKDTLQT